MALLKDLFGWEGPLTAQQRRTEESHQDNRKRMQALLDSEKGQQLLTKARAAALDRGESYYGGRRVDPYVKGSEDLGKIRAARDKFSEDEMTPETLAYFDAAEKSVLNRMKRDNREYFGGKDFVGPPAPARKPRPSGKDEMETSKSAKEYFQPSKGKKPTELELQGMLQAEPIKDETDVVAALGRRNLGDYFQAPTDTVPEGNIPKTYPQMGITSIDDQATLQEMQDALPDVDMKSEYEADPEMMQKLMELWRTKKLTKQNLHKAFSMIQQTAQQSLGIR